MAEQDMIEADVIDEDTVDGTILDKTKNERMRRRKRRRRKAYIAAVFVALLGIIPLFVVMVSAMQITNQEIETPPIVANVENLDEIMFADPTPSPEPTAAIPSPHDEPNLIQIIADAGQTKRCYLTFDDGPTDNITPQILAVLKRYGIKATFFELGSMIDKYPDMAKRVYQEGHLIANHAASHDYAKLYATTDSFIHEVNLGFDKIREVMGGKDPFPLFRYPGGSYNAGEYGAIKQEDKVLLSECGYYYCDWNSLNGDAEGADKNADELFEYFKTSASVGYNNLIVLMHDSSTKQATVDALPNIIESLAADGYTFHRLDEIDYQPYIYADSEAAAE